MSNSILNIISLGLKPLLERQRKFDDLISEFRERFANPARAGMVRSDIEDFFKRLDDFDFKFVLFQKYYIKYIENLNRFKPNLDNPDITFLRIALAENKWKPTKPFPILVHYLKYGFRFTSKPYISHQKKENRKKIEAQARASKIKKDVKSSNNWTRVPLTKTQSRG